MTHRRCACGSIRRSRGAIDELEQHFIAHALQATGGRVTEAAELLGLSRKGLFLKRRRRGLVPVATR